MCRERESVCGVCRHEVCVKLREVCEVPSFWGGGWGSVGGCVRCMKLREVYKAANST